MNNSALAEATKVAETYYDSADADCFYQEVWGGEDIHIGLYEPDDTIFEASRKTVRAMAERLSSLRKDAHVLDLGSGYGGAARTLAAHYSARVTCLNLSKVENDRNRELTRSAGLSDRIDVIDGAFEEIPLADESVDIAWSQDAILHSGDRRQVLREVARVLRPGGEFIFTDPMQADLIEETQALQPIYDRLHLTDLGSIAFYREAMKAHGFEEIGVEDMTGQMAMHYSRIAEALQDKRHDLERKISADYIDRMMLGLNHWVEGAHKGNLAWGILHFMKR
jgi:sarcosine/dimethylglycine N-methyltransferase